MLFAALFLVLPLVLFQYTAMATHSTCSWQPTKQSPETLGYVLYCKANFVSQPNNQAIWTCSRNGSMTPANLNHNGPGVLELRTPCGGYGWARDASGNCPGRTFATCFGASAGGNCYYMQSTDDCQWPGTFKQGTAPNILEIWVNA